MKNVGFDIAGCFSETVNQVNQVEQVKQVEQVEQVKQVKQVEQVEQVNQVNCFEISNNGGDKRMDNNINNKFLSNKATSVL